MSASPSAPHRVYVIGDSISVQYRPYLQKYLPGLLTGFDQRGTDRAMQNLDKPQGTNCGDSSMLLILLRGKAESGGLPADTLLLNCGLHDIKTNPATGQKQVPLDQYRQNLTGIIAVVRQMGLRLIWIRTTPIDDHVHNTGPNIEFHRSSADVQAYNAAADGIMRAGGVPIVDLYNLTLNLGDDLFCDHAHFHEHIREKQAAYIAGWLAGFSSR